MGKIVVARLIRLGKEGDSFKKDLIARELRTSVKIDEDYIKEFNKTWKESGQLYQVDAKATKERDAALNKGDKNEGENLM